MHGSDSNTNSLQVSVRARACVCMCVMCIDGYELRGARAGLHYTTVPLLAQSRAAVSSVCAVSRAVSRVCGVVVVVVSHTDTTVQL
ncbi:hypothetical protein J6590_006823 [Homalodisca vitripennis]|nr:hypothetical protein J6590_006823 [Homalodisca vitripennis]